MDKYLKAAFESNTAKTVPIVFAANQGFAPVMAVAIASVLQHCSDARNYDIVVLESNVTEDTKRIIQSMAKDRENVSMKKCRVGRLKEWNLIIPVSLEKRLEPGVCEDGKAVAFHHYTLLQR